MRCADASASEPLAGTATVASRFLLVEHRGRWGRDPLDDETGLEGWRQAVAAGFEGRVLLLRRPDRREAPEAAFVAEVEHGGGVLRSLARDDETAELDEPLFLVCTHGSRDRCCAQLGVPVFDALSLHVGPDRVWQSSHHGGHRFAANVLVLPYGVQLGRVAPGEAGRVAELLAAGRIPLELYRGRTLDSPRAQAADAHVRRALNLDHIAAVRAVADDGATVDVETPSGVVHVRVEEQPGPSLPVSCGAEPQPTSRFVADVE